MSEKASKGVYCSFCGKGERGRGVKKIIAGPSCYICNECIVMCLDMLEEDGVGIDLVARYAALLKVGARNLVKAANVLSGVSDLKEMRGVALHFELVNVIVKAALDACERLKAMEDA